MATAAVKTLSRQISSNQTAVHQRLPSLLRRHLARPFSKPIAAHNQRAFEQLQQQINPNQPVVIDSFCGVGQSTAWLASQYPECQIIGIDKSAARLQRHPAYANNLDNYQLLRADTDDIWRLIADQGWPIKKHCLFYPNPWPKSQQLQRRIHGSPLFPTLLQIGGELELRSNWRLYVEEFASALHIAGFKAEIETIQVDRAVTPFEAKYHSSGQPLWRCICSLN